MNYLTFDWSTQHLHGDLWWRLLSHRHNLFVDQLGWDLPTAKRPNPHEHNSLSCTSVEFDQYDSPHATYIVVLDDAGEIAASARLIPTNVHYRFGPYDITYMINDAERGLLRNIPRDLTFDPCPLDPRVWELTRYTSTGRKASAKMAEALNTFLAERGARSVLSLSPSGFERMSRTFGYPAMPIGREHLIDGAGFRVFETDVQYTSLEMARGTFAPNSHSMREDIATGHSIAAE